MKPIVSTLPKDSDTWTSTSVLDLSPPGEPNDLLNSQSVSEDNPLQLFVSWSVTNNLFPLWSPNSEHSQGIIWISLFFHRLEGVNQFYQITIRRGHSMMIQALVHSCEMYEPCPMQNGDERMEIPLFSHVSLAKIRIHETEAVSMALWINIVQPWSKAHLLKNNHHQCSASHSYPGAKHNGKECGNLNHMKMWMKKCCWSLYEAPNVALKTRKMGGHFLLLST